MVAINRIPYGLVRYSNTEMSKESSQSREIWIFPDYKLLASTVHCPDWEFSLYLSVYKNYQFINWTIRNPIGKRFNIWWSHILTIKHRCSVQYRTEQYCVYCCRPDRRSAAVRNWFRCWTFWWFELDCFICSQQFVINSAA